MAQIARVVVGCGSGPQYPPLHISHSHRHQEHFIAATSSTPRNSLCCVRAVDSPTELPGKKSKRRGRIPRWVHVVATPHNHPSPGFTEKKTLEQINAATGHETKVRNIGKSQNAGFGQIIRKEVPQPKLVFLFVVRGHPCRVVVATQPMNRYHATKAPIQGAHIVAAAN